MSDRQLGFRSAPGAQLLRLGLLGVFEVIMGLHEQKPRTLPIVDRMRLLQARLRLPSPHIDASHEPTPPSLEAAALQPAIVAKRRNVPLARRQKFRAQPRLGPSGMRLSLPKSWRSKARAAVRDGARIGPLRRRRARAACNPLRKVGFEAGEFRPRFLRLAGTGALAVRRCLYEIVYEMGALVPCRRFAVDVCVFLPPFRGVFAANQVPPTPRQRDLVICRPAATLCTRADQRSRRAEGRSRVPDFSGKSPDLPSA